MLDSERKKSSGERSYFNKHLRAEVLANPEEMEEALARILADMRIFAELQLM